MDARRAPTIHICRVFEPQNDVGGGQIGRGAVRPLDHAHALPVEIFIQSSIKIFLRLTEPIEIKVI